MLRTLSNPAPFEHNTNELTVFAQSMLMGRFVKNKIPLPRFFPNESMSPSLVTRDSSPVARPPQTRRDVDASMRQSTDVL